MSLGTATDGDGDREKDKAKNRDMGKDEDKGIDKTTRRNEKSVNSLPHTSTLPRSNCMTNELKCIALCCATLLASCAELLAVITEHNALAFAKEFDRLAS